MLSSSIGLPNHARMVCLNFAMTSWLVPVMVPSDCISPKSGPVELTRIVSAFMVLPRLATSCWLSRFALVFKSRKAFNPPEIRSISASKNSFLTEFSSASLNLLENFGGFAVSASGTQVYPKPGTSIMDSDLSIDWLAASTPLAACGPDVLSVSIPILRVKLQGFKRRMPFFPSSPR